MKYSVLMVFSLSLLVLNDCFSQKNVKEIKEIKIYAYPFGRKIRLAINPNTIKSKSLLELKLKHVIDLPYSLLCKALINYLEVKQESQSDYLGDVRMLMVVKLKGKKKLKIFISNSNRVMIKDVIYDINDNDLKSLLSPLEEYFKPERLRN